MQKTLVIIPCYNEEKRLPLEKFRSFLKTNQHIDILFVDDGSIDNTYVLITELSRQFSNVKCLKLKKNVGKAEAVRQSVLYAGQNYKPKYIGYFDADLSTSLNYINKFTDIIDNSYGQIFMVTGSRIKRLGSKIKRSATRHFFGRLIGTIASHILSLPVYDTQCGAKIFDSKIIDLVFSKRFISKWLFDIEIYARLLQNLKYEDVITGVQEYPLEDWHDDGNSRIKLKDFMKVPIDLLKIALRYSKRMH